MKKDKDRKKYDREARRNIDVLNKVDVYKYDRDDNVEEECIVDVDDVIDI